MLWTLAQHSWNDELLETGALFRLTAHTLWV